jgi:hypothetical protein
MSAATRPGHRRRSGRRGRRVHADRLASRGLPERLAAQGPVWCVPPSYDGIGAVTSCVRAPARSSASAAVSAATR